MRKLDLSDQERAARRKAQKKKYAVRWRAENPEKCKTDGAAYRQRVKDRHTKLPVVPKQLKPKLSPEQKKLRARHYRSTNRSTQREAERRYRQTHSSQVTAKWKKWAEANRDKVIATHSRSGSKRRARMANTNSPGVSLTEWAEILETFNHQCAYCLAPFKHCDHVIAIAAGGTDSINNVVPSCARCNVSKGAKSLPVWLLTSKIAQMGLAHLEA